MFQILFWICAAVAVALAYKAFTTGLDLGVGSVRFQGTSGIIVGVSLLVLAVALVIFSFIFVELFIGR